MKGMGSFFVIVGLLLIIGAGLGVTFHFIPTHISVPTCLLFGTVFVTTGNIIRKKENRSL
ncbi:MULTISPECIES: hypothetical protein [unclassified Bacillus (in: firmicutes)]|uniref:hypothetical protein n=1 Tax=unclassified Bacillus (in: firmicutes) TaxID=185979 RepID=UPI0008E16A41|nr:MULTISPECIES: hypothetical protein [unclassified Bacillus (in: firmicutes)]SFI49008.1 hypothetical protein SAMN04488574_10374 [Bacillus sp. 71mf]SFS49341.1 hypothetical protein SAMN04488145_101828 [Bacillus sp. 103mf]